MDKHELIEKVYAFIQQEALIKPRQTVAAAVSGGADSVCLLSVFLALKDRLDIRVRAVHVEHGLRPTSHRDQAFVEKLCREKNVPLDVFHVDAAAEAALRKRGLEETARELRYEAFFKVIEADVIALAHHQRDQAETLWLNLMRGSGLMGLSAMPPARDRIIRPLLILTPEEIRGYLQSEGQDWMEDETNQNPSFRRNFIRGEGFDWLKEHFNPNIVETLARTASLLQKDEALLDKLTEQEYPRLFRDHSLSIEGLLQEPEALRSRLLRKLIREEAGLTDVSWKHMEAIEDLLQAQSGLGVDLPGGSRAVRSFDRLLIDHGQRPEAFTEEYTLAPIPFHGRFDRFHIDVEISFVENVKNYTFSKNLYTKSFDYDTIKDTIILRTRRPGDFLSIGSGHKKLKDYMIEEGIPRHLRDSLPLLACGPHVLWVIGYRMSDAVKLTGQTKRVIEVRVLRQANKGET